MTNPQIHNHDDLGFIKEFPLLKAIDVPTMEETEVPLFRSGLRKESLLSLEELIVIEEGETKLLQGAEMVEFALEKLPGLMADNPKMLLHETTVKMAQFIKDEECSAKMDVKGGGDNSPPPIRAEGSLRRRD